MKTILKLTLDLGHNFSDISFQLYLLLQTVDMKICSLKVKVESLLMLVTV